MVKLRKTGRTCPICGAAKLEAAEFPEGRVSIYRCECGAVLDAEPWHDWTNNQHGWIARHRNPAFWEEQTGTFEEGLQRMFEKIAQGIPDYLGVFYIEGFEAAR